MTPDGADFAATRDSVKNARAKSAAPRGAPIEWPDVLRVLPGDETRSYALGRYRARGFGPDDFGWRRGGGARRAREAMADALTYTEDWLELLGRNERARAAIREVRRALELELWP